jgi:DNA repair protein RadC
MSKRGLVRDLTDLETVYAARTRTMHIKLGTRVSSDGTRNACSTRLKTMRVKLLARFARPSADKVVTISNLSDVELLLDSIFARLDDDHEHFVVLFLNGANEVIGYKRMASGPCHAGNVDPKLLYRSTLLLGAPNIILAHNHPSGNTTPEPLDILLTGSLVISGRLLNVDVLDHFIYTRNEQLSMRETFPQLFEAQE